MITDVKMKLKNIIVNIAPAPMLACNRAYPGY